MLSTSERYWGNQKDGLQSAFSWDPRVHSTFPDNWRTTLSEGNAMVQHAEFSDDWHLMLAFWLFVSLCDTSLLGGCNASQL